MLLQKYNSDWVSHFIQIKQEIDKSLVGLAYTIEHVGSTSVPDLDAKPIIDIDIIYYRANEFEKIKVGLEKAGYYHNGNQGIEGREVFKRIENMSNGLLDKIIHHLYVCPETSKALERHIVSRNFLRKHPWARLKYQAMKYELAERAHQDKKLYAALKERHINQFIDLMIKEEKSGSDLLDSSQPY